VSFAVRSPFFSHPWKARGQECACADECVRFQAFVQRLICSNQLPREPGGSGCAQRQPGWNSDFQGHGFFRDPLGIGQDCHALNHVAQLANVPGPSIALQQGPNLAFNPFGFEIVPETEILQKVFRKRPDILNAFAQRRHANRHDAESIIEVLPEFFLFDQNPQVSIGCGYHPHSDSKGLASANALEFPFLQDPQQFGLRCFVQVPHFIQKDRTAICQFKLASPARRGSRERSFFVSEELAFQQVDGNRGTVDLDEGAGSEWTRAMQMRGYQLFARSGFAHQQHTRVGTGDLACLF